MAGSSSVAKFRRAKPPIKRSPSSNVNLETMDFQIKKLLEPIFYISDSIMNPKLTPMPSKRIQNFDLNLPGVKLGSSAIGHFPIVPYALKAPGIKREAEPVKVPPPPPPHQDLLFESVGHAPLALKGCQRCQMYVLTPVGNDRCPCCRIRVLKEFQELEREAHNRDAAKRIKLDLSLSP